MLQWSVKCFTQQERGCELSVLELPRREESCGEYLLMSSWFIRKGDIRAVFVMEGLVYKPAHWETRSASQAFGCAASWVLRGRGERGLHKHGGQSAGIAPHSRGAFSRLIPGVFILGALALFNTITTAPFKPWSPLLFHMYKSLPELENFHLHSPLNG